MADVDVSTLPSDDACGGQNTEDDGSFELNSDISGDSDEVSLMVVDEAELAVSMKEAGVSIKEVDNETGTFEVEVLQHDVSTFLVLSPEDEYLGAKVQGFIPREDGGLSALEMHGQLVEGDILTHLNGNNARQMDFSDILKACRDPERGGLPRPLTMRFSRAETLTPLSPLPMPQASTTAGNGGSGGRDGGDDAAKPEGSAGAGGSSLLEDLMGGLNLPVFNAAESTPNPPGQESGSGPREGSSESKRMHVPGMSQIKDAFRAELQAQGMLGGGDSESRSRGASLWDGPDGSERRGTRSGNGNGSMSPSGSMGEKIFFHMLRRLESIEILGEDNPPTNSASNNGDSNDNRNGVVDGTGGSGEGGGSGGISRGGGVGDDGEGGSSGSKGQGTAGAVGSSLAGVGAKLRSTFRKPSGFGLSGAPSGAIGGDDVTDGAGKTFVEGASKALAMNRERVLGVMGWVKDLRPKDWSPKEAGRRAEEEARQELRAAVRRLYLDAPDPPVHTAMVVARARPTASKSQNVANRDSTEGEEADRVIGTGADKRLTKMSWFRSSSRGGFAEIDGVDGAFYQPSADDIGTHICVKCTLTPMAMLSPARRTPRKARGAGGVGGPLASTPEGLRHQTLAFAEVGPILLDPVVGAEVNTLLSGDEVAVFRGLERRGVPGETVRVRLEIFLDKVRVLKDRPGSTIQANTGNEAAAAAAGAGGDREGSSNSKVKGSVSEPVTAAETVEGGSSNTTVPGSNPESDRDTSEEALPVDAAAVDKEPCARETNIAQDVMTSARAEESLDGAEVLEEGRYAAGGVLVALDPSRSAMLKLTMIAEGGNAADERSTVLILRALDGRQRDVLALTLRGRRQAALGPDIVIDDFPEATQAAKAKENYFELKAAAAHFAAAYDEDDNTGSIDETEDEDEEDEMEGEEDEDDDDEEGDHDDEEYEDEDDDDDDDDDEYSGSEGSSDSCYSIIEEIGVTDSAGEEAKEGAEGEAGRDRRSSLGASGMNDPWAAAAFRVSASRASLDAAKRRASVGGEGFDGQARVSELQRSGASPWEAGGEAGDKGSGNDEPRSLSHLLEDLRHARATADSRERQLKEAHALWEAGEASREKAEAELKLVVAEVDLLRPLSRSLAIRAEVATNAEERAEVLSAEAATLREELTAAQNEVEALTSRVGAAEEDAQAKGSRLSGLEKVVRRLGGETEVAQTELAAERTAKDEAIVRASKAERELDQAKARAAVLENKTSSLEREKLELLADTNAAKARAEVIGDQLSAARATERGEFTSRLSELEKKLSSLEQEKAGASSRMREAEEKRAGAEATTAAAMKAEAETRAEMSAKVEQLLQLTAQRNSAKHRADSLAKDLSRVCGGGRTLDQIEAIVTKYADLKVKMAMMEAEKDGEAEDNVSGWDGEGTGSDDVQRRKGMAEATQRALRQNTELNGRVAALTEAIQMKGHQLEGQRRSNEFLLKRVEELEMQIARISGAPRVPPVGTD